MSLIKCTSCGNDVSDNANICPNCGEHVKRFVIHPKFKFINTKNTIIITIALALIFATFAAVNFFSEEKAEAQEKWDEYFSEYLDCQSLWRECLEIDYDSGAEQCKQLMNTYSNWMDDQEEIIADYNTRAIVFTVLASVSAVFLVVIVIKKNQKTVS